MQAAAKPAQLPQKAAQAPTCPAGGAGIRCRLPIAAVSPKTPKRRSHTSLQRRAQGHCAPEGSTPSRPPRRITRPSSAKVSGVARPDASPRRPAGVSPCATWHCGDRDLVSASPVPPGASEGLPSPTPSPPAPDSKSRRRPSSAPSSRNKQEELESLELMLRRQSLPKQDRVAAFIRRSRKSEEEVHKDLPARVFSFEGPDEYIRQALLRREPPWVENRLPGSALWDLKWCISDSDPDYRELQDGSWYNHFQNNRELTTKIGLANNLRQLAVEEHVDIDEFFPRCYDMSVSSEREDFVLDYRRCAALNVAQQHLRLLEVVANAVRYKCSGVRYLCNLDVLRTAALALTQWLEDLDGSFFEEEASRERKPIRAEDWDALVVYSEVTDGQLCRHEEVEQRRERNRGFSASGTIISQREGSPPRSKTTQRPADLAAWPELQGHLWAEAAPPQLEVALKRAVAELKAKWPQMGAQGPLNVWIMKPGTCSKGSGVMCVQGLPEVLHHCKTLTNRIVQKYVERPLLLFSGRKFDIRQWVLVRSFNPLRAYMFSSCYLRLCNEPYDLGDLANRQRHISNWSVNRHGKHVAEGAVASLEDLRATLKEITGEGNYWEEHLQPRVREAILHCLRAVQNKVVQRDCSFELYGFDFLISDDLRPWLLEVNLSPACDARTPWITAMLERMASRLLEVVLDGKTEPDGMEPDWLPIAEAAGEVGEVARGSPNGILEEMSPSAGGTFLTETSSSGHAQGDLLVIGKPISLRAERRFDEVWRRKAAQSRLARAVRRHQARNAKKRHLFGNFVLTLQRIARLWLARQAAKRCLRDKAAREVQRFGRRFLAIATLQTELRRRSAILLQRRWLQIRRRQQEEAERRSQAALRIQQRLRYCLWRRHRRAAKKLQAWWRPLFVMRRRAAIILQALARQRQQQRRFKHLLIHYHRPALALTKLLALVKFRNQVQQQRAGCAAMRIQALWRGHLGRCRATSRSRGKRLLQAWHLAAAQRSSARGRLQTAVQRWLWRRRFQRRCASCTNAKQVLKAACRRFAAQLQLLQMQWLRRIAQIQGRWRGVLARKHQRRLQSSVLAIQSAWRGRLARLSVRDLRRFLQRRMRWAGFAQASGSSAAAPAAAPEYSAHGFSKPPFVAWAPAPAENEGLSQRSLQQPAQPPIVPPPLRLPQQPLVAPLLPELRPLSQRSSTETPREPPGPIAALKEPPVTAASSIPKMRSFATQPALPSQCSQRSERSRQSRPQSAQVRRPCPQGLPRSPALSHLSSKERSSKPSQGEERAAEVSRIAPIVVSLENTTWVPTPRVADVPAPATPAPVPGPSKSPPPPQLPCDGTLDPGSDGEDEAASSAALQALKELRVACVNAGVPIASPATCTQMRRCQGGGSAFQAARQLRRSFSASSGGSKLPQRPSNEVARFFRPQLRHREPQQSPQFQADWWLLWENSASAGTKGGARKTC